MLWLENLLHTLVLMVRVQQGYDLTYIDEFTGERFPIPNSQIKSVGFLDQIVTTKDNRQMYVEDLFVENIKW